VTVHFTCGDNPGGSGIGSCTPDTLLSSETTAAGVSITGTATDNANNSTQSAPVGPIKIDLTAPTVTGVPSTPVSGTNGTTDWYKGDVTIGWTTQDGLSGVDAASVPGATISPDGLSATFSSVIGGEGHARTGSASAKDQAGNTGSGQASVNIDRTPPVVTGQVINPSGTIDGWYNSAVTVAFSCSDPKLADGTAGSGCTGNPTNKVVSADGANQSVTSDPASDYAGNAATGTLNGISIDSTKPTSHAAISCTQRNGWCKGSTATVVLTAIDNAPANAANTTTSGIKEIDYSTNGGTSGIRHRSGCASRRARSSTGGDQLASETRSSRPRAFIRRPNVASACPTTWSMSRYW
jgi:hypothetical protein